MVQPERLGDPLQRRPLHSYALHLLRQGVPLKTIGDVLGHRSPDSTTAYLRLATEDLRTVALPVPTAVSAVQEARG
jgi:integrase/recombinase XerD